jgi:hypothetical protein
VNYQIYTMYINRKDLLCTAIHSIDQYLEKVVILDNSREQDLTLDDFPGEIYRPDVPLFCSQSYNLIMSLVKQRQQDVFFMMHSDAIASNEVIRQLLERAEELNRARVNWGVLFTSYDVLCLSNTKVVQEFQWDPYLPLYYTDVDYYHRLRLAGVELIETDLPVAHNEGGSTAMKEDVALNQFVKSNYPAWRQYYLLKWGGERDQERYATPFNL